MPKRMSYNAVFNADKRILRSKFVTGCVYITGYHIGDFVLV